MSVFASRLDAATATLDRGNGRWAATVHDGWDVAGVPNGGYLMAIMSGAMTRESGRPDAITVTSHFLTRASVGAAEVRVEVLRAGRRFSTVRGELLQGGRIVAHALGAFGDLSTAPGDRVLETPLPEIAPFDECIAGTSSTVFPTPPIAAELGLRLDPRHTGFTVGAPHGVAEMAGWAEFPDGRSMDTHAAIVIADGFPPPIFNSGLPVAWTPTIELTVHMHRRPEGTRLAGAFRTDHVIGGYVEEDGLLWDTTGRLVAVSRQMAIVGT